MPIQTPNGTLAVEGTFATLAALIATSGALASANVHLYQSNFAPTERNVWADYSSNEANFPGYSAQGLTWSGVGIGADGNPVALSDRAFFLASSSVSPNQIGGAVMTQTLASPVGSVIVLDFFQFANPVNVSAPFAFVGVVIGVQQPNGGGYAVVDS